VEEAMKKCVECGSTDLAHSVEQIPFNDVALVEGSVHRCNACGRRYYGFSRVEELSREVARSVAKQEERLQPEQVRFLRKYLGYSSKDFADFLAVAAETVSRWESRTQPMQMQLSTEKLIRLMALSERPIAEYGLDRAGSQQREAVKPFFREDSGHWTISNA
jgi:putative zinc finger/helix-turn-helix YgiT family protein